MSFLPLIVRATVALLALPAALAAQAVPDTLAARPIAVTVIPGDLSDAQLDEIGGLAG